MSGFELVAAGDARLERSDDLGSALAEVRGASMDPGHRGEFLGRLVEFASLHPDAAFRSCEPGHLTGSALVVDGAGQRTLLMLHRKLGRWFQPGGHADGDANVAAVALREAHEETGIDGLVVVVPAIDVDVHQVSPPGEEPHLHFDVRYLVLAPPQAAEHGNEESLALRWVGVEDLDALDPPIDESTRRLVERGMAVAATLVGGEA